MIGSKMKLGKFEIVIIRNKDGGENDRMSII
jgi:hypothetical protein